ncbi:putative formin-like protein 5 [Iris pallida]|uniref:Formin-like protein 5 n=1 Tax=Iris pallida TaxID=29817 RepID=A0AAX6I2A1_IRIPA|nr:putative formin-like protein 5 [Iris pallida]
MAGPNQLQLGHRRRPPPQAAAPPRTILLSFLLLLLIFNRYHHLHFRNHHLHPGRAASPPDPRRGAQPSVAAWSGRLPPVRVAVAAASTAHPCARV